MSKLKFSVPENPQYEHALKCSCGGCMIKLPDSVVESLADCEPGTKFEYECPEHGMVEHILTKTEKERAYAAKKYPGPTDFVHLHNHTIYSALDGVAKPEEYFQGCAECDLPAFAITDHGSIAGVPDAYWAATKNKVKYISGCEIYFNDFEPEFKNWQKIIKNKQEARFSRKVLNGHTKLSTVKVEIPEMHSAFVRNRHLTVLCKNMEGYKNLIKINNIANEKGFYYKPRIWYDLLRDNKEGLVILSGCLNGPVCHSLRNEHPSEPVPKSLIKRFKPSDIDENGYAVPKNIALQWIMQFREDFGDDFYLELQMPGDEIPKGRDAFRMVSSIGRKLGIKSLLTNDCLSAGYPILMADGTFKPIESVVVGDEVITHKGRAKKVVAVGSREKRHNENMWSVYNTPWSMTDNHPLYISDNLTREETAAINKPKCKLIKLSGNGIDMLDTKKYVDPKRATKLINGFWKTSSPKSGSINIPEFLPIDSEFLWILGNYIAEGYRDKYRISFACHKDHVDIHNKIINYFKKFGLNPDFNINRTNSNNGAVIRICSAIFADIFSKLSGRRAENKHLPDFWMKLNNQQAKHLLDGYIDGDGSRRNKTFTAQSTSWQLIGQLSILISNLGGYAKPLFKKEKIYENGRIDRCAYNITSSKLSTSIIEDSSRPINHKALSVYDPINMTFKPKWNKSEYNGLVYDIEVEDDHTFVLWGGIISRNCHYLARDDFNIQMVMMATAQDKKIDDPTLFHVNSDEQFFKTRAQMRRTFIEHKYTDYASMNEFEQYCDNTLDVSDKCNMFEPNLDPKLPGVDDADKILAKRCIEEMKRRGFDSKPEYVTRLRTELERIIEKEFSSYFLITADIVNESKKRGWPVGPARGSAGGSLLCYLLDIIELDPVKFDLSFDRFLSASRGGYMLNAKME